MKLGPMQVRPAENARALALNLGASTVNVYPDGKRLLTNDIKSPESWMKFIYETAQAHSFAPFPNNKVEIAHVAAPGYVWAARVGDAIKTFFIPGGALKNRGFSGNQIDFTSLFHQDFGKHFFPFIVNDAHPIGRNLIRYFEEKKPSEKGALSEGEVLNQATMLGSGLAHLVVDVNKIGYTAEIPHNIVPGEILATWEIHHPILAKLLKEVYGDKPLTYEQLCGGIVFANGMKHAVDNNMFIESPDQLKQKKNPSKLEKLQLLYLNNKAEIDRIFEQFEDPNRALVHMLESSNADIRHFAMLPLGEYTSSAGYTLEALSGYTGSEYVPGTQLKNPVLNVALTDAEHPVSALALSGLLNALHTNTNMSTLQTLQAGFGIRGTNNRLKVLDSSQVSIWDKGFIERVNNPTQKQLEQIARLGDPNTRLAATYEISRDLGIPIYDFTN